MRASESLLTSDATFHHRHAAFVGGVVVPRRPLFLLDHVALFLQYTLHEREGLQALGTVFLISWHKRIEIVSAHLTRRRRAMIASW